MRRVKKEEGQIGQRRTDWAKNDLMTPFLISLSLRQGFVVSVKDDSVELRV